MLPSTDKWLLVASAALLGLLAAWKLQQLQSSAQETEPSDGPTDDGSMTSDWTVDFPGSGTTSGVPMSWWPGNDDPVEPTQTTIWDTILPTFSAPMPSSSQQQANLTAFLSMIAAAEGANYDTLFGGGTFESYADHPRQLITRTLAGKPITSSAAGRYQFLARTWDGLRGKLGLQSFSPASQDAGAIELIREKGALADVYAGRVQLAISKVRKVWASLPGAGYNQPEKRTDWLIGQYQGAGGAIESEA